MNAQPDPAPSAGSFICRGLIPCLVVALCLIPFIPGLSGPFQHDDLSNLPRLIVGPFGWESLWDVAVRNESGLLRRPLSNIALALNYWGSGISDPFPFKLGNLLVHGLTGLAAYWLCVEFLSIPHIRRSLPASPRQIALLAAAIWVIHPLQVSTALYVVQRMAQLATLFSLVAVAWALHWTRAHWSSAERPSGSRLAAAGFMLASLLAIASKENGVLTPVLLLACLLPAFSALRGGTSQHAYAVRNFRPLAYLCIALPLALGLTLAAFRPELVIGGYAGRPFTWDERLLTQSIVLWKYISMILLPRPSEMGLYHEVAVHGPGSVAAWIATAGLAAMLATATTLMKRAPILSWALLWFFGSHLLESSLLPLEMIYEHRNYTGLLGFSAMASWGIFAFAGRTGVHAGLIAALPIALLASLTFSRAVDWSSPERFYAAEYRHHPESFRALLGFYDRIENVGAFPEVAAQLKQEIIDRRGDEPWVALMLASEECGNPDFRADWDRVLERVRNANSLGRFSDYAHSVLDQVIKGHCRHLDLDAFSNVLKQLHSRALYADDRANASMAANLNAWVHRHKREWEEARSWHWRASSADPDSVEPLFELAYLELNQGNPAGAQAAIEELKRREDRSLRPVSHRLREIEGHLQHLLETQSQ
ncbi:tetratricopeptide repeat protein [Pseudomarimonas salicorniae]|uniref:Tetratricopeptide repeat protein n=1 Tax=Pseudomarimonas salicorniae TaxID=2933270 RepID=A0ABT0GFL4_9GAMM|nr:hypothetical protein [Lysobacter sp. CAU 1642]MCK7593329.1 hypothetical protein [Lysobacter sp. CAU 1642]